MVITVNLEDAQITRANRLILHLSEREGEIISRSEVVRRAIDALFLSECLTDKTNGTTKRQSAIATTSDQH